MYETRRLPRFHQFDFNIRRARPQNKHASRALPSDGGYHASDAGPLSAALASAPSQSNLFTVFWPVQA